MSTKLYRRLGIEPGLTAIIGSGGKTTLIDRLWRELPGTVIVCTSTHIYPAAELPLFTGKLEQMPVQKLCLGTPAAEGKLTAPEQDFETLKQLADYVLVEADGAKKLPLKAHLDYEPVIPPCADRTICVVGLSGLGRPIRTAAHRFERYAELCGAEADDIVTPFRAAQVLNREDLADLYVLNQADDEEKRQWAAQLGSLLAKPHEVTCLK